MRVYEKQPACTVYLFCCIDGVLWSISHGFKVDDPYFLGLSNPVGPGYSLLFVLGVGVGVIHHHCVSCLKVQASASCPDAQQEDEDFAVWSIEPLYGSFPAEAI